MQWSKFTEFTANNLSLAKCLDELIAPQLRTSDFPSLQSWVESQVDYICVRPWSSLLMETVNRNPSIEHFVYHHIEGEELSFSRVRYARCWEGDSLIGTPISLGETITGLTEWHGEYWAKQVDRPLVLDAVVRKRTRMDTGPYRHEALEFFIFPSGFTL